MTKKADDSPPADDYPPVWELDTPQPDRIDRADFESIIKHIEAAIERTPNERHDLLNARDDLRKLADRADKLDHAIDDLIERVDDLREAAANMVFELADAELVRDAIERRAGRARAWDEAVRHAENGGDLSITEVRS